MTFLIVTVGPAVPSVMKDNTLDGAIFMIHTWCAVTVPRIKYITKLEGKWDTQELARIIILDTLTSVLIVVVPSTVATVHGRSHVVGLGSRLFGVLCRCGRGFMFLRPIWSSGGAILHFNAFEKVTEVQLVAIKIVYTSITTEFQDILEPVVIVV